MEGGGDKIWEKKRVTKKKKKRAGKGKWKERKQELKEKKGGLMVNELKNESTSK